MSISLRDIIRWLVAGTVLGFGLFIGARVADAIEPSPAPAAQAATTTQGAPPPTCEQTTTAPAPSAEPAPAAPAGDSVTASEADDDDDDDGPSFAERVARMRARHDRGDSDAGSTSGVSSADLPSGPAGLIGVAQTGNGGSLTVNGETETDLDQAADAMSGDAVAGGQVMGIASSGTGGGLSAGTPSTSVNVENDSTQASANSGAAQAGNTATISAPVVSGGLSIANSTVDGPVNRTIVIDGDVEIKIKQESVATSGDAIAGSQVIGVAGGGAGAGPCGTTIVARNRSEDSDASSGDAAALNTANITAPLLAGGVAIENSTVNGPVSSIVNVTGDVKVKVKQSANARSGDALAGSQVLGATGDCASAGAGAAGGGISVDASNTANRSDAGSGAANAANDAVAGTAVPLDALLAVAKTPAASSGTPLILLGAAVGGLGIGVAAGRRRRRRTG